MAFAVLGAGCAKASAPTNAPGSNPFRGKGLYVESRTEARRQANQWREFRPDDASLMAQLARQPTALWVRREASGSAAALRAHLRKADRQGTLPVVVLQGISRGDCDAPVDAKAYRDWFGSLRKDLARSRAVVILEPGVLETLPSCSASERTARLELLQHSVNALAKGRTAVYIAAGIAGSEAPPVVAERLRAAGIEGARGFALNVGHYVDTKRTITYGVWLGEELGNKPFVVDTSRNGMGAPSGDVCNARGRGLGLPPTTTDTRHELIDAYLWVKVPGESDGECNGGPAEGEWWPKVALELVRNTPWIRAAALLPSAPTPPLPPEPGPRGDLEFNDGEGGVPASMAAGPPYEAQN